MQISPYRGLSRRHFWKTAVRPDAAEPLPDLFIRKFAMDTGMSIATAGSCFAQHISRHLSRSGFQIINAEPAPEGWPDELSFQYGYNVYSARYGNIYTAKMLRQLMDEAFNRAQYDDIVWEKEGRYYDAKRPAIEPLGFESPDELFALRHDHIRAVRQVILQSDIFIFTLGLTEGWISSLGTAFAGAPGTIAGSYDPNSCSFINHGYIDIIQDLESAFATIRGINPKIKILLTVSPVPLTATASKMHILVSNTYSKSVLRAVAGDLSTRYEFVDYFPSYEIITGVQSRGRFFDSALASVTEEGVDTVMRYFSESYGLAEIESRNSEVELSLRASVDTSTEDIFCEEILLANFAEKD